MSSTPLPVYYVVDDPYPDSTLNTFSNGGIARGRTDGHVYDEPEVDLSRSRPYVVMDNSNGMQLIKLIDRLYYISCLKDGCVPIAGRLGKAKPENKQSNKQTNKQTK